MGNSPSGSEEKNVNVLGLFFSKQLPVPGIILLLAGGLQMPGRAQPVRAEADPFVRSYCLGCHSEQRRSGGVVLEHLDFADAARQAEILERVARKLHDNSMPPPGTWQLS